MLVLALTVWSFLSDHFDTNDPFLHVMVETVGSAHARAKLFVLLGLVHRLFLHRM